MDVVVMLIMAAAGLSAVSSHAERQYHFVYEAKTISEAQRYCREKHTDLATVDSMEVVQPGKGCMRTWTLSDPSFYKPGEMEFRRWGSGQPGNTVTERCSMICSPHGLWDDVVCDNRYCAVCCEFTGPNVRFLSTDGVMTWTKAQSYCREHHTDLASVRNPAKEQQIVELLPGGIYWIGLYRDSGKWSDGSFSSFRYWAENEPNHRAFKVCVAAAFHDSGKWEGLYCGLKKPFICYGHE